MEVAMTMSPEIDKLAEALSLAQAEIKGAPKDAKNPHFGNSYATLDSVLEACREPLTKNGIAVIQLPCSADGLTVNVRTMLTHKTGQWIACDLTLKPVKADPQGMGSAITYGRRYALAAMAAIAPMDDDGNGASGHDGQKPQPQRTPEPEPPKSEDPELMRLWAAMKGKESTAKVISSFREPLGESEYSRILGMSGIEQAEQIASIEKARVLVKALLMAKRATERMAA